MDGIKRSPLRAGLASRNGTLAIAAAAALLAGVLVFAALNSARDSGPVTGSAVVIVADQLIPKGSSGSAIAQGHLYRQTQVRESALVAGAVTDVSQLRAKVATDDIYPGQQITAADFEAAGGALTARLTAAERAIAVPLDGAHGMLGEVHGGDRVDVLSGFNVQARSGRSHPVMTILARNVVVLKAPKGGSTSSAGASKTVTLRVNDTTAAKIAFAAEEGKVWVVLRPPTGAQDSKTRIVSLQSLLLGLKPVAAGGAR